MDEKGKSKTVEGAPAPVEKKTLHIPDGYTLVPDFDSLEDVRGLHSSVDRTASGVYYTSDIYGFHLIFPQSWGALMEKESPGLANTKIFRSVHIASVADPDRFISIQLVKPEDNDDWSVTDYPQTLLGSNDQYVYYYSGGGDMAGAPGLEDPKFEVIANEVSNIARSFSLR